MDSLLTVVAAPAGWGKTTLLSEWAPQAAIPVAWLSLDPADNALSRFLAYLIMALRNARPKFGEKLLDALLDLEAAAAEPYVIALIREIAAIPQPFALVLDDYQSIEAAPIHDALIFLLAHVPTGMRLLLASRREPTLPLSRLRANGQLTELRTDSLRFNSGEAAVFLNDIMGCHLSPDQVAVLQERTEGWIAGLQMAALSVREKGDGEPVIQTFEGSNRYVFDYLGEEVLQRQPEELQAFLVQTSILNRLSGGLCDAVTGQTGSQAILEHLDQAHLFIVPLDETRRWYRYHHLFADLLRSRLGRLAPGDIQDLHRRAGDWYARNCQVEEAIYHALQVQDWAEVIRLAGPVAAEMMIQNRWVAFRQWMQALPEEALQGQPTLCLAFAWTVLLSGLNEGHERLLSLAEKSCPGEDEVSVMAQSGSIRASAAFSRGDLSESTTLARQALDLVREQLPSLRVPALMILGMAQSRSGALREALQTLTEAHTASLLAGAHVNVTYTLSEIGRVQIHAGRLRQAEETLQSAIHYADQHLPRPIAKTYIYLGELHLERNELQAAEQYLHHSLEIARHTGMAVLTPEAHLLLGRLHLVRREPAQARQQLAVALSRIGELGTALYRVDAETLQARIWLAEGELATLTAWIERLSQDEEGELPYRRHALYRVLAQALLLQARQQNDSAAQDRALRLLERLLACAEADGRKGEFIETLVLQALAREDRGETSQAMASLERALSLAAPEGHVRPFVEEVALVERLLARARERRLPPAHLEWLQSALARSGVQLSLFQVQPGSGSILSERERDVLRLLAAGLTNQEIADTLFVSINTIRTHLSHLYGKLSARSRTQAVARARELKLL